MIVKLKNIVKNNCIIYKLYYLIGSLLLKILGFFLATDDKLILLVVYGGQRYDDSPRFVYEYMKNQVEFRKYHYVWAFTEPEKINLVPKNEKVKIDTLDYYICALKAHYWITNSSASRGLNFKKKNTVNIMYQHGMAGIKKIGNDIVFGNKSFGNGFDEKFDYIFIEGKKESDLLKKAWDTDGNEFKLTGLPRNDELINFNNEKSKRLKIKIGIPEKKKVILYAPTYREYFRDSTMSTYFVPPINFDKWYCNLGDDYVLLLTAHYEVQKLLNVPKNHPFVINAFKYPYINDLLIVSDILISDYSSIIFDYSILNRPIISFAYDYEIYKNNRGLYCGYDNLFYKGIDASEDSVIEHIKNIKYEDECRFVKKFIHEKYVLADGKATEKSVQIIFGQ